MDMPDWEFDTSVFFYLSAFFKHKIQQLHQKIEKYKVRVKKQKPFWTNF